MKLGARKHAALLTGLVILLALIVAAYWLLDGAAPKAVPQRVVLRSGEQSMTPGVVATIEPTPASTRRIPGPGEVEICGRGVVSQSDVENPLLKKQFEQHQAASLVNIQQRLMASTSERDRVAGLMMQTVLLPRDDVVQAYEALNQNCGTTHEGKPNQVKALACAAAALQQQQAVAQYEQRRQPIAQQLVLIARGTTDPVVYAQAVKLCASFAQQPSPPECGAISLTQWSRLDPRNMEPWLWALERAQQQQDEAGAMEALYQASRASYEKSYIGFVAQQVFGATAETNEVEQAAVLLQSGNLMFPLGLPPIGAVMARCSVNAVTDANRRQVCEDVANRLVAQSDTLIDQTIGIVLGTRLGWAPERVATLRDENSALREVQARVLGAALDAFGPGEKGSQDCAVAVQTMRRQLRLINELGQPGAAQQMVSDAGFGVQQGTLNYVQWRAQQQAQAAASAPQH